MTWKGKKTRIVGDIIMERTVNHMENLIFSLNATVPIFLLMLLGLFFRKIGWIDEVFASKMNKFVFTFV